MSELVEQIIDKPNLLKKYTILKIKSFKYPMNIMETANNKLKMIKDKIKNKND